jgi:LysM repeat protein
MQAVQVELDKGNLAEALRALSSWYGHPELPVEQAQAVTDLLDQLAGTVIYSRRHLLEPPYVVQPGDTIDKLEQTYNVPWQLLARINGLPEDQAPQPGTELKVVRGPFKALINLDRYELTLMLDGRYAGRFPIGIGSDHERLAGTYVIRDKLVNPQYYGPDQTTVDADDPNNPLGELWIGLSDQNGQQSTVGIHGTNDPANLHRTGSRGSICLGDRDINDLYGILSIGSRVVIRR